MKKKINFQFILITVTAIIITIVLSTLVSYSVLKHEVIDDLRAYAYTLKGTGVFEDNDNITYTPQTNNLRITIVESVGTVVYDSMADASTMENHENRTEIKDAIKSGEGKAIRKSATLGKNTFYYAVLLDDGSVLRVAKESSSLFSVLVSAMPVMLGVMVLLTVLSVISAHLLTKSIVAPIEEMAKDLDRENSDSVYKELRPFVSMIQKQHADIVKTVEIRQEFTANVSHELKTPLTSISGYAELMENGMATEEDTTRFAGEIHRNANRLLTLINDIIRLSELDATVMEVEFEQVDLYQVAQNCVSMLAVNAENHFVSLDLHGTHCLVMANREMMNELVYNLCDNAIRYNNKNGSVNVIVDKNEEGKAYLEVKDTGIGIPQEHQQRIFERFYRVDKSRSKSTGGTGLGLAIVKHIVVQSHAVLQLESEPGKGTMIRIVFGGQDQY